MASKRESVFGTTPQDLKKINDNFESLWYKVNGDLSFEDTNSDLANKISTQWIPVQGEGNLDSTHPLYIRFYIPPNVSNIKTAKFSIVTSRYRMDSENTDSPTQTIVGAVTMSTEQTIATASASLENTTVYANASSSSVPLSVGATSGGGGSNNETHPVEYWGTAESSTPAPTEVMAYTDALEFDPLGYYYVGINYDTACVRANRTNEGVYSTPGNLIPLVDLVMLQHTHRVNLPNHTHTVSASLGSHSHSIAIDIAPHTHTMTIAINPHTHQANFQIELPPHSHSLVEKIKDSITSPTGVNFKINNVAFGSVLSGDNQVLNDVDIASNVLVGQWNVIEISSTSVARVTMYGIIEMIQKYYK